MCERDSVDWVETLYTDTLQFLYHLSLAMIVGGGFVLGAAAAPRTKPPPTSIARDR